VLGPRPRAVVILAGVNDVYQGRSAESVTVQLRAMYDGAARAGIPVVAGSIVPYNTATPAQNAVMHEVNAWIAAEAMIGVRCLIRGRSVDFDRASIRTIGDSLRLHRHPHRGVSHGDVGRACRPHARAFGRPRAVPRSIETMFSCFTE
jgi:hypothetical protein